MKQIWSRTGCFGCWCSSHRFRATFALHLTRGSYQDVEACKISAVDCGCAGDCARGELRVQERKQQKSNEVRKAPGEWQTEQESVDDESEPMEEISWFRHLLDRSTFSDLCLLQLPLSLSFKSFLSFLFLCYRSFSFFASTVTVASIFDSRSQSPLVPRLVCRGLVPRRVATEG